ncbi:MAG TPA: septum formation initiator family protein [Candidatus Omnitrophota bacterium]|nr:septum formation initiator family protein [Candidatus Omnitrophota bacterium]
MLKIFKQTSVLVFLGLILIIFFPGYAKIQEMRHKNRKLEADIKRLKAENIALSLEKEKLETDPNYLEQVAREKLGIVKKGETVYRLVPQE